MPALWRDVNLSARRVVTQPAVDLPSRLTWRESRIERSFSQEFVSEFDRAAELGEIRSRREQQPMPVSTPGPVPHEVERCPVEPRRSVRRCPPLRDRFGLV